MMNEAPAGATPTLATVHEAVRLAVLRSNDEKNVKDDSVNFKCVGQIKEAAMMILGAQGSDLSKFLQACVELLVRDYAGEKGIAKISQMPVLTAPST